MIDRALERTKGKLLLIEALARLAQEGVDCELVLVGEASCAPRSSA